MNKIEKIIIVLFMMIGSFITGAIISSEYERSHINTEQCLSVCVEEFEKYGC